MSDTMAAALWTLDYLFLLAQFGCAGANIETGVNQLGFVSWYSPIAPATSGRYRTTPVYQGMLAFSLAGHGDRLHLTLDAAGLNFTAYAVRSDRDGIWATLVNKEASRDAHVRMACPKTSAARVFRLTAPSLSSKEDVRLSRTPERAPVVSGELEIAVPGASAALVQLN